MSKPLPLARRSSLTVIALVAIMLGVMIFAFMAHSYQHHDDFARLDTPVLNKIAAHRDAPLTTAMILITNLLSPVGFAIIVTVLCAVWAWRKREAWRPLVLMGAMALAMIASTTLKHLFERARPPQALMIAPFEVDYSFPSGHTLGVATFVFVLGYLLYSARLQLHHAVLWAIGGLGLIALVAFSRLYLGYHWLTDVTASVGVALVILGIVIVADTFMPARFKQLLLRRRAKAAASDTYQ